ncbi:MAG TPA: hypothetical protein DET40_01795 [Lentisphaeria bacterium]|nr:MAG: hypothetical protein A2X45_11625 [Lentisphaerae bacterium GWF2_50_93]HCE42265.1 hypothetical protein [Lentisphaeria bacterium]
MRRKAKFKKDSSVPLYRQVSAQIARDIASGKIRPAAPLPSINNLTDELGVARNTVIQAMRQLVHDGYAVAKQGKGFFSVDRNLKPVLNMIVPLHHYYYIQVYVNLIAGAQDAAARKDEKLLIYNSHEEHAGFVSAMREVATYRPNAKIIVVPPCGTDGRINPKTAREIEKFTADGVRMIIVDRQVNIDSIPLLVQDKLEGRKLLLRKLFEGDCKAALFFNASEDEKDLKAFACESKWNGKLFFEESGGGNFEDLSLIRKNNYDAVFCVNDLQARRIVIAAGDNLDFKIAGYDGTVTASSVSPRITTVNSNLTEAGELAFKLLSEGVVSTGKIKVKPFIIQGETF